MQYTNVESRALYYFLLCVSSRKQVMIKLKSIYCNISYNCRKTHSFEHVLGHGTVIQQQNSRECWSCNIARFYLVNGDSNVITCFLSAGLWLRSLSIHVNSRVEICCLWRENQNQSYHALCWLVIKTRIPANKENLAVLPIRQKTFTCFRCLIGVPLPLTLS